MPYISPQEVKEMRLKIKAALPSYKISVVTRHHSEVLVTILQGPVDFGETYIQTNHYHLERDWAERPECLKVLLTIKSIIENAKAVTTRQDSDYGSIPNYYTSIHVGKWDKPYIKKA